MTPEDLRRTGRPELGNRDGNHLRGRRSTGLRAERLGAHHEDPGVPRREVGDCHLLATEDGVLGTKVVAVFGEPDDVRDDRQVEARGQATGYVTTVVGRRDE